MIGLAVGKITSGSVSNQLSRGDDQVQRFMAFGMGHLTLLTALALIVLFALIATRKAIKREGVIVYFGVGICVARIISALLRN
jgi:hypothetical protein